MKEILDEMFVINPEFYGTLFLYSIIIAFGFYIIDKFRHIKVKEK